MIMAYNVEIPKFKVGRKTHTGNDVELFMNGNYENAEIMIDGEDPRDVYYRYISYVRYHKLDDKIGVRKLHDRVVLVRKEGATE